MTEDHRATRLQRRVLVFLSRAADLGLVPSLADVGRRFNLSKSRVRHVLQALHRRGLLRRASTDGLFCDHVLDYADTPDTNRTLVKP